MDLHDLTAAYALDALDADEAEAYERHLGQCEECREQLAELNEAAASLAFGDGRARAARRGCARRSSTLRRPSGRTSSRSCGVAGSRAGSRSPRPRWPASRSASPSRTASRATTRSCTLIGRPEQDGDAHCPASRGAHGKTYEAWVIPAEPGRRGPRACSPAERTRLCISAARCRERQSSPSLSSPPAVSNQPTRTPFFVSPRPPS